MRTARLAFELSGPADAPPLVLGNSLGTTWTMWDAQAPVLARHFRLLRFNHRGHGGSQVLTGPYTIAELGRDLVELLDSLGWARVSYCGLSLGGLVGMWLGAHVPDRIDRLALCCASGRIGTPSQWHERAACVRAQGTASVADTVVSRWFTPTSRRERSNEASQAVRVLAGIPSEGYAGCCEAVADTDLQRELRMISAPTLVIAGADDPVVPVEQAAEVASNVPGARLAIVPRAAHLANIEQPDIVTRLLLDFLIDGEG